MGYLIEAADSVAQGEYIFSFQAWCWPCLWPHRWRSRSWRKLKHCVGPFPTLWFLHHTTASFMKWVLHHNCYVPNMYLCIWLLHQNLHAPNTFLYNEWLLHHNLHDNSHAISTFLCNKCNCLRFLRNNCISQNSPSRVRGDNKWP